MPKGKNGHRKLLEGLFLFLFFVLLFPTNAFLEDNKMTEELIRDLRNETPLVRWKAAERLGITQDPRAVAPLIEALGDEDAGVRKEVTKALGEIGDPRAVKPLGKMLDDDEEFVRVLALHALEKIGGEEAVNLIIGALKNASPVVRVKAAASVGRIGDTRATGPLEEVAQNDAQSYVRFAAQQALVQLKAEDTKIAPQKAQLTTKTVVEEDTTPKGEDQKIPPQKAQLTTKTVVEEDTTLLIAELKQVAERIKEEYGLVLDYKKYDIMELLDIEARMRMRHPHDTMESVLGDLLTDKDKERNRYLFEPKQ